MSKVGGCGRVGEANSVGKVGSEKGRGYSVTVLFMKMF